MGFVTRITALALAATASVAAVDLGDVDTKVSDALSQADTNGTSCLLLVDYYVH